MMRSNFRWLKVKSKAAKISSALLFLSLVVSAVLYFAYFARAAVLSLHPSGAATGNAWSLSAGTTWADALDSNDGDTTYAYATAAAALKMEMDNHTTESGSITGVVIKGYFRQTTGNEKIELGISVGGTDYLDPTQYTPGTSYALYSYDATSVRSWTWTDIDNMIGLTNSIKVGGWGGEIRATELWVEVTYTAGDTVTATNDGTMTPSSVVQGQTNVVMQKLGLSVNANDATWTSIKVTKTGTSTLDGDVASVNIYTDGNGNGVIDGADASIGSSTFSAGTATIDITDQTITTTAKYYLVVYNISNSAATGVTVGSRIASQADVTVASPDTVASFTNHDSGLSNIGGNTITVTNDASMTPSSVTQGQTNVAMQKLGIKTDNFGTATLTWLKVNKIGTSTLDSDVQYVKIYLDNGDGNFNAGSDTLISSGTDTFSSGVKDIDITDQTITTTYQYYFVVYNISSSATTSVTVGSRIANQSSLTVTSPDTVNAFTNYDSGLASITEAGDVVTVTSTPMKRGSVTPGWDNVAMQQLDLKTGTGTASWTAIKINEYGTGTATTNISAVKIYKENNVMAGLQLVGASADTLLSTSPATFSAEETTFTFTSPETIGTTPSTYYIVYDMTTGATTGTTVGSRLANQTYITVASPDTVASFTNYDSRLITIVTMPHGSVSQPITATTNLCQACHAVHLAPGFAEYTLSGTYLARRILVQPYFEEPGVVNVKLHETFNALCESCHDGTGSTKDIKTDYNSAAAYPGHLTKTTSTLTTGYKPPPTGQSYNAAIKLPCMICHDAHTSTKGNYKMLADELYNYAIGQGWNDPSADGKVTYDAGNSATWDERCRVCHRKTTETTRTSIIIGIDLTLTATHDIRTNCLGCHLNPHALSAGESAGNQTCSDCHTFFTEMNTSTTTYHHYMQNAGVTTVTSSGTKYPNDPQPTTEDEDRRCLMCHVDHDIFVPEYNPSGARAKNLRTDVTLQPTTTTNFTNADFDNSLTEGGICTSCHKNTQTKNTAKRKPDGTTTTMIIYKSDFNLTAHNYRRTSQFKSDTSSLFYGNCVKCHNTMDGTKWAESKQDSTYRFELHDSPLRRLLAILGIASPSDPLEENFCFRCHSTDENPYSGTGYDYYNVALMSSKARAIKSLFTKTYTHPITTAAYVGRHRPVEGDYYNWLPATNRHVECEDCHNPHAATTTTHTKGSGAVGGVQKGVWGVTVTYTTTAWVTPTYTRITTATLQYQICLKCHSDYAYASSPPNTTYADGTATPETNQALEFNPNNYAYHPIISTGKNQPAVTANPNWGSGGTGGTGTISGVYGLSNNFVPPFGTSSTLVCSDCHDSDSETDPEGPHGSTQRWLLRKLDTSISYSRVGQTAYSYSSITTDPNNFCLNCHRADVYGFYDSAGYTPPTNNTLSRQPHPMDTTSYQAFETLPDSGIICQNCHGGDTLGGIHGTNAGKIDPRVGSTTGASYRGKRFLNGAAWSGITRGSTTTAGSCWRWSTNDKLNNCTNSKGGSFTANANYDYEPGADP